LNIISLSFIETIQLIFGFDCAEVESTAVPQAGLDCISLQLAEAEAAEKCRIKASAKAQCRTPVPSIGRTLVK
jgi:hypothetical protein